MPLVNQIACQLAEFIMHLLLLCKLCQWHCLAAILHATRSSAMRRY
jgi:hypothetical protein